MSPGRLRSFFFPDRAVLRPLPYALVVAAGIACGVTIALSTIGERLELDLYDLYMRRQSTGSTPAPGIVVVAIDEPSFTEVGIPWPWPRLLHATLIDRLVEGGARSIAFDLLFDLPAANAEDDGTFGEAIRRAGNVVLAADQAVVEDRAYAVAQWTEPLPSLARHAAASGVVRIPYDPDGVLRRAQLGFDGRPSLALAIASREPGFQLPAGTDVSSRRLFRFNGESRRGVTTVSYYQALDAANSLPPGMFTDKHVLIGRALDVTTPAEVADHFTTPVALRMSGVEVHATIVDALLRDRFIGEPFAESLAVAVVGIAAAFVVGAIVYAVPPASGAGIALLAIAVMFAGGYVALAADVHLPVVATAIITASAYAFSASYRFALVSRERRVIKRAFQHYVAPAIVDKMLADPSLLQLGGEEYEVTVLFSDLEGFTSLSERLSPAQLSAHLGEYFTDMLDVLLPHGGTLDKLIGDAIMMYFGCPIRDDRHALQACRAALALQRAMSSLNERWSRDSLPRLRTRVGINTGIAVAGNMGTKTIFNYTLLGDAVNLASRLEGVNREYGTLTIIGADTWARVHEHFETRELDWIRAKGKEQPTAIYELIAERGAIDGRVREVFDRYADGLRLYRARRWSEAAASFERALRIDPHDGPSRLFARRCTHYDVHAPTEWDGVHVMQSK